jgi:hypothetical protein
MKGFLGLLISGLFVAAFVYYLNLKSPDVRYQLSTPITTGTDAAGTLRVVQQIEVANLGNAVAQKVQVKLKKSIGKPTVMPDSRGDTFQQFDSAGSTELIYDALRPAGRFQIVLSDAAPLSDQDIEVRHLEGIAKPALGSQSSTWSQWTSYLSLALAVLYSYLSSRKFFQELYARKVRWEPEAMLKRKKPLLLSNEDWESMLEDAAWRLGERNSGETADVSSWVVYRLLDSPRPESVAAETWDKVLPKLAKSLLSRAEGAASSAQTYGYDEDIRKLLVADKPLAMYEEPWAKLMASVGRMYVATSVMASIHGSNPSTVLRQFSETRPQNISENQWESYMDRLRSVYFEKLFYNLRLEFAPFAYLRKADLTPLSPSEAESLRQFAYQHEMRSVPDVSTATGAEQFLSGIKPDFMSERDYLRLTDIAKTTKQVAEDKRQYVALLAQLKSLIAGSSLAETADGVPTAEWANLRRIEGAVVTAAAENQVRAADLSQEEAATAKLKTKVLKQLAVINTVLGDSGVLDRIEDYEELFAPGNLSNLRRLVALRSAQ